MKAEDLLLAIGEIDEADVLVAKRRNIKPWQIAASSLAACLVLVFLLPGILINLIGFGAGDVGNIGDEDAPADMAPGGMGEIAYATVLGADGERTLADAESLSALQALLSRVADGTAGEAVDTLPEALGDGEYRIALVSLYGDQYVYLWMGDMLVDAETQTQYPLSVNDKTTLSALLEMLE